MRKLLIITICLSAMTSAAWAATQSMSSDIRESTDPAKVAEVERRAQDIQARQQEQQKKAAAKQSSKHAQKHGSKSSASGTSGGTGTGMSGDQSK